VAEPKSNPVTATADREIVISRVLDAPRVLVFDLWTDPQHVAAWYGPRGFTITTLDMDVRAGGGARLGRQGTSCHRGRESDPRSLAGASVEAGTARQLRSGAVLVQ
jgi:hypothetical protein